MACSSFATLTMTGAVKMWSNNEIPEALALPRTNKQCVSSLLGKSGGVHYQLKPGVCTALKVLAVMSEIGLVAIGVHSFGPSVISWF